MKQVFLLIILWSMMAAQGAAADTYEAVVDWQRRVELGPVVSGVVESVAVEAGDQVQAEQELLALEETPFAAAARIADGAVKKAGLERQEQANELERAQELYDRQVLSTVELDKVKLHYAQLNSAYQAALARREEAHYRLRHSKVRAPFDGIVLKRQAEVGQNVVTALRAPVLIVLVEKGAYLARARVPLSAANAIEVGGKARVEIDGRRYDGSVRSVSLEPEPGDQQSPYAVEVQFKVPQEVIRAGTPARVELP